MKIELNGGKTMQQCWIVYNEANESIGYVIAASSDNANKEARVVYGDSVAYVTLE